MFNIKIISIMMLWVVFGIFLVLSLIADSRLKTEFRKYSAISIANGISEDEIPRNMLYDHGCYLKTG
ncbi:MAG: hypothetical protein SNJ71_00730 [Bacteroidales bacterium]